MWEVSVTPARRTANRMRRAMASDFARNYGALSCLFVRSWTDAPALTLKYGQIRLAGSSLAGFDKTCCDGMFSFAADHVLA